MVAEYFMGEIGRFGKPFTQGTGILTNPVRSIGFGPYTFSLGTPVNYRGAVKPVGARRKVKIKSGLIKGKYAALSGPDYIEVSDEFAQDPALFDYIIMHEELEDEGKPHWMVDRDALRRLRDENEAAYLAGLGVNVQRLRNRRRGDGDPDDNSIVEGLLRYSEFRDEIERLAA